MSELPEVQQASSSAGAEDDDRRSRRKTRRFGNPLQAGVYDFINTYSSLQSNGTEIHALCSKLLEKGSSLLPRRFTVYSPLLLLPSNFLPSKNWTPSTRETDGWLEVARKVTSEDLDDLWRCLITAFRKDNVTHIAIGAPIESELQGDDEVEENVMRSPTSIRGVYGDFGLTPKSDSIGKDAVAMSTDPSSEPQGTGNESINDGIQSVYQQIPRFGDAFWVQSVQNGGIIQCWAPMWTMFSRGNIKEKARILSGIPPSITSSDVPTFHGLDGPDGELGQSLADITVLDMYIGIGYFAFSYLKRGVGLVIGFELNPWSVQGLRRGAEKNGWKYHIVPLPKRYRPDCNPWDHWEGFSDDAGKMLLRDSQLHLRDIRLLIFQGDNGWAPKGVPLFQKLIEADPDHFDPDLEFKPVPNTKPIRHINLGLLPTSSASWSDAETLLNQERGGWIHVHENVEVAKIEEKARKIEADFQTFAGRRKGSDGETTKWDADCVHIERVKTYAPGIMHCVFDLWIHRSS